MKKAIPYIIGLVLLVAIGLMLFSPESSTGKSGKAEGKKWSKSDQEVSLRKDDKKPYGLYVAYQRLADLFPKANISSSKDQPGQWDSISFFGSGQAVFVFAPRVMASRYEFKTLLNFAENGNDVFISTFAISSSVSSATRLDVDYVDISWFSNSRLAPNGMSETLVAPWTGQYSYKGKRMEGYFDPIDTLLATPLGRGNDGKINFVHLKAGKGNLYIHLSPLSFSNYFLLQPGNINYYEKALSVVNPDVTHIVWDEYFISNRPNDQNASKSNNWFSSMAKNRELAAALAIAGCFLLLYVLLGMRRRQRSIPVQPPLRNDSLDFVKTVGRLYFEKGDHTNLARKMTVYFLEHLRSRYQLSTGLLNDEFIQQVVDRTGVEEQEVRPIVETAARLQSNVSVSDKQLETYYRRLEKFYQQA
ncbi:DUF4350 domain-containing protein [Nostoc ellipsosporum NOK]|nr:DUF4350 domain-containing protein [Nostoc ellipsosporum NOK]